MAIQKTQTRMERGITLHRSCGHQIIEVEPGVYRVPSSTGRGFYRVDLERETCECPDHEHRRVRCLHFYAAIIFAAKKRCRRADARPQRRHGQPSERHGGTAPRPDTNRPGGRQGYGPRRSDGDSLRGVVPVSVAVAGLERMGV